MTQLPNQQAIGVFDSGVGGLSVANQIRDLLPNESLIYIADSANAPYGNKSAEFITQRCQQLTQHLLQLNCKLIVVACNTATVNTISQLRQKYQLPFVGVEPGIKPAVALSKNGNIGIWATASTLASATYARLVAEHGQQKNILGTACHGLAELVERGDLSFEHLQPLINHYLQPLLVSQIDTLVLGCTHYPFLKAALTEIVSNDMHIVDTSLAIAEQVKRLLHQHDLGNDCHCPHHQVFTSADVSKQQAIIKRLWGDDVNVSGLPI